MGILKEISARNVFEPREKNVAGRKKLVQIQGSRLFVVKTYTTLFENKF